MTNHIPHSDNQAPKLPVELESWLNEQPQEEADALENVWNLATHARLFDVPSEPDPARFNQMREDVLQSTTLSVSVKLQTRSRLRLGSSHWLKLAASLILLVLAGSLWWTQPVTHSAPSGEQRNVQLSDGSTVSLNSGSQLAHNRSFGSKNRRVTLKGEAFFDVAHNDTPFIVENV